MQRWGKAEVVVAYGLDYADGKFTEKRDIERGKSALKKAAGAVSDLLSR